MSNLIYILKEITADADICRCIDCKCAHNVNGCVGGCGPNHPCLPMSDAKLPEPVPVLPPPVQPKPAASSQQEASTVVVQQSTTVPPEPVAALVRQGGGGGCCSSKTNQSHGSRNAQSTNDMSLLEILDRVMNSRQTTTRTAESVVSSCSCDSLNEGVANGCCVVVCLKSLEILKYIVANSALLACNAK